MKIKQLEETLNRLYNGNNLSIYAYSELMEFADPNQGLPQTIVSKSIAIEYAEFCVKCDREGLPLLELDDYIKQYCA